MNSSDPTQISPEATQSTENLVSALAASVEKKTLEERVTKLEEQVVTLVGRVNELSASHSQIQTQPTDLDKKKENSEKKDLAPEAYRILKFLFDSDEKEGPSRRHIASGLRLEYGVFMLHFGSLQELGYVRMGGVNDILGQMDLEYVWLTQPGREALDEYEKS